VSAEGSLWADRVRKLSYCTCVVPARPGRAAAALGALREAGVDLLAFTGFPVGGGRAQLDFAAASLAGVRRVARREGWRLGRPKRAFLIQGSDRTGAVHQHLVRLAEARINVTAVDAVTAGAGRYGAILWVKPRDYARASRALRAR
jgi:hypothetical protein